MMKKLDLITLVMTLVLTLLACSTPMKHEIDLAKLKPEERAYKGNIQVELNGKRNPELTCDLFLNSDISPMVRLSPEGDYQFKSIKKKLAFSRISCIHNVNKENHWIHHSLDLARVTQPKDNKEIYDLGGLEITWKVDDSEFKKEDVFGSEDKMRDVGQLEIKPTGTPPSPQI